MEAAFLGPLDVRKIPGVGKVSEATLAEHGIRKVRDLARLDEAFLAENFGRLGVALAGKAKGEDAKDLLEKEFGNKKGLNITFNPLTMFLIINLLS